MKNLGAPLPNWGAGACHQGVGVDTEIFFTDDKALEVPEEPASYCRRCDIQADCLAFALEYDERGVWGNTTYEQRKRLKRGITRVHCPGCGSTEVISMWDESEICLACGLSWRI